MTRFIKSLLVVAAALAPAAAMPTHAQVVKASLSQDAPAPFVPMHRKMTPFKHPKSAWICYTPYGSCFVPYLGPCSCCNPYGCAPGST
jgi:hypothetical protein